MVSLRKYKLQFRELIVFRVCELDAICGMHGVCALPSLSSYMHVRGRRCSQKAMLGTAAGAGGSGMSTSRALEGRMEHTYYVNWSRIQVQTKLHQGRIRGEETNAQHVFHPISYRLEQEPPQRKSTASRHRPTSQVLSRTRSPHADERLFHLYIEREMEAYGGEKNKVGDPWPKAKPCHGSMTWRNRTIPWY